MSYIQENKEAWEEAFEHRRPGWGERNHEKLADNELPFFYPDVAEELQLINFTDKTIAQFCCNNGRELLSLMQLGVKEGVGFDIAENIVTQATDTAMKANIRNCRFVSCNILEISEQYSNYFDFIMFTVGAITWFDDLNKLFQKVFECLKPGGILFINDFHPMMNMLPMPGEPDFKEEFLNLKYSYFRKEPWIENDGMEYMSEQYASKTFTSFSHTMSAIINAISSVRLHIVKMNEYDYDIGLADMYDKQGFPLSYILIAQKQREF